MAQKKIVGLFFLSLLLLGIIFIPGYARIKKLARENQKLEKQIKEIRETNLKLKEEQQRLKADPFYLEKVAREKLGVARKGEIVYRVVPAEKNQ